MATPIMKHQYDQLKVGMHLRRIASSNWRTMMPGDTCEIYRIESDPHYGLSKVYCKNTKGKPFNITREQLSRYTIHYESESDEFINKLYGGESS